MYAVVCTLLITAVDERIVDRRLAVELYRQSNTNARSATKTIAGWCIGIKPGSASMSLWIRRFEKYIKPQIEPHFLDP